MVIQTYEFVCTLKQAALVWRFCESAFIDLYYDAGPHFIKY